MSGGWASGALACRLCGPGIDDLVRFLDQLDTEIPVVKGQQIVAVSDNLSTRDTQEATD